MCTTTDQLCTLSYCQFPDQTLFTEYPKEPQNGGFKDADSHLLGCTKFAHAVSSAIS